MKKLVFGNLSPLEDSLIVSIEKDVVKFTVYNYDQWDEYDHQLAKWLLSIKDLEKIIEFAKENI